MTGTAFFALGDLYWCIGWCVLMVCVTAIVITFLVKEL